MFRLWDIGTHRKGTAGPYCDFGIVGEGDCQDLACVERITMAAVLRMDFSGTMMDAERLVRRLSRRPWLGSGGKSHACLMYEFGVQRRSRLQI